MAARTFRPVSLSLTALVLLGAVLLGACSTSGYHYVTSHEANTYFKVPHRWKLYSEDDVFSKQVKGLSPQQEQRTRAAQWVVAFDASPEPSLAHVLAGSSKYPQGFARVRVLRDDERDTFSLASLRTELLRDDPVEQESLGNPNVEVVRDDEVVRAGGLHGSRMVVNLKDDKNRFFTVDQTALVDSRTRLLYLFLVGCEARCYVRNQKTIDRIVDSWTIKERR